MIKESKAMVFPVPVGISRRQWPFASKALLSSNMYEYCSGYMLSYGKYTVMSSNWNFMTWVLVFSCFLIKKIESL